MVGLPEESFQASEEYCNLPELARVWAPADQKPDREGRLVFTQKPFLTVGLLTRLEQIPVLV
jgi:hypothetical protein